MSHPESRPLFRHGADRASVAFVLFALALHLAVFFTGSRVVLFAAIVPLFLVSILVAPLNHHHQHLRVFHPRWMNRVYDVVLALQTGVGPYTWVLHHNLGHHRNYLNQPPHPSADEAHWTRKDGSRMGRVEYSLHLFFHHPMDVLRVGRRHPRVFRTYLLMKLPLYAVIAAGLWWNPIGFLLAFTVPGWLVLLHTCWATYEHHAGNHAQSHMSASVNRENALFNALSWNLGYHTAHHLRPSVHWSDLPALHRSIRDRIPKEQLLATFW